MTRSLLVLLLGAATHTAAWRLPPPSLPQSLFAWMWQVTKELLLPLRHTMYGRTSKALGTVETSNHSYQTKAPLNEALGTVETSNHSYQTKAPLKAIPSKVNCTFLRKCL